MELFTAADLARMRQAMMLGTARSAMPIPDRLAAAMSAGATDPALALLVLAGQRQRLERPEPVACEIPEAAKRLHQDPLPILPDESRRIFGRLLTGVEKSLAPNVIPAARRRIALAGFRPHPFDLPALADHLDTGSGLSLSERAYLSVIAKKPEEAARQLYDEEITAENWTNFPKGQRREFLTRLRARDAEAGRALLESCWGNEQAATRGELLYTLATGLGPGDVPFLESLAKDRAESVRTLATRLLAQVQGSESFAARLAEAAACFAVPGKLKSALASAGIADGGITFTPPKAATARERTVSIERLFEGVTLPDLASATGLEAAKLLNALPADGTIANLLLRTAIAASDADTVRLIVEHRMKAAAAHEYTNSYQLVTSVAALGGPLSRGCAKLLLISPGLTKALSAFRSDAEKPQLKDDGTLVLTAALMPDELMEKYLELLQPLLPSAARGARDFAELALSLQRSTAHTTQAETPPTPG